MSDVQLDSAAFFKRAKKIFDSWENPGNDTKSLKDLSALAVIMGKVGDDEDTFTKTSALHLWLLGYEFPSTVVLFRKSPRRVTFICGPSKAKLIGQLKPSSGGIEVEIKSRPKDATAAQEIMNELVASMKKGRVGTLPKDKPSGKIVEEWNDAIEAKGGFDFTDIGKAISAIVPREVEQGMEEQDVKPAVEEKKPKASASKSRAAPPAASTRILSTKTRGGNREQITQTTSEKIKSNQARLHAQLNSDGVQRFEADAGGKNGAQQKVVKRYESYRREEQLPRGVEDRRVYVDEQRQSVVVPINGYAVPYHISTIKNVTKTEESNHIVLRVNFQSPGQIAGKKEDMPFEDPDANFIRSISFRSQDSRHMIKVYDAITALKKAAVKREAERKEMADVIEQEKLIEVRGRSPYVLKNVFPRPGPEGKKTDGNVEIHQNGIRFRPDGPASKIDILFSNIKHLFFQPSEKELIVIIHVHLKAPIMLGKKKTSDVQFYREVADMSFDETGGKKRRARYGDEDEIEQEQEDRKRRAELDKVFQDFARRIESAAQAQQYELEVDVPFRELGFQGVPHKSIVSLLPTTNCLIQISEFPFTVITLSEVEIVHLERVQFGLKNFDMVFVVQDLKKPPIHVNSIPVAHIDNVKEWLDSCDVPISEGPLNLAWPAIMKSINEDPHKFYAEGGWTFLTGSDSDDESDESEEGSEFEGSEGGDESDFSSEEESGSNFGDGESDSGSEESLTDEGDDWDELELKAKKADERHKMERGGDSDDDGKKKKKGGRR